MSNNLAEEFEIEDVVVEIKTFKDILNEIKGHPNPSKIVTATIEKATIFLDLIHSEVVNGEYSPRNLEVASQILNTIITASGFLSNETQTEFENKLKLIGVKQKDREIDIKEKEAEIKELYYNTKKIAGDTNNNIIVTDYNSILKFLDNKNVDDSTKELE